MLLLKDLRTLFNSLRLIDPEYLAVHTVTRTVKKTADSNNFLAIALRDYYAELVVFCGTSN